MKRSATPLPSDSRTKEGEAFGDWGESKAAELLESRDVKDMNAVGGLFSPRVARAPFWRASGYPLLRGIRRHRFRGRWCVCS